MQTFVQIPPLQERARHDFREPRPSVDGKLCSRSAERHVGRDRRGVGGRGVFPDPRRPFPEDPAQPAARADLGDGAEARSRDQAAQEPKLRGQLVVPRCRRVAASCSGCGGRNCWPDRVCNQRLGVLPVRSRPQSGVVRVLQPAGRAVEPRCGATAGLFLGLRHRPRDPHGGADHRAAARAGAGVQRPRTAVGDPHLLPARRHGRAHLGRSGGSRSGHRAD